MSLQPSMSPLDICVSISVSPEVLVCPCEELTCVLVPVLISCVTSAMLLKFSEPQYSYLLKKKGCNNSSIRLLELTQILNVTLRHPMFEIIITLNFEHWVKVRKKGHWDTRRWHWIFMEAWCGAGCGRKLGTRVRPASLCSARLCPLLPCVSCVPIQVLSGFSFLCQRAHLAMHVEPEANLEVSLKCPWWRALDPEVEEMTSSPMY